MADNTEDVSQQRDAVSANWDALQDDDLFTDEVITNSNEEESNNADQEADNENEKSPEENEGQESGEEGQEETEESSEEKDEAEEGSKEDDSKDEKKDEKSENESDEFEIGAEEAGFKTEPEDGTWLAVAKAQGVEIQEDTYEAFADGLKQKHEAELAQVKQMTKDDLFAGLKPETVSALKLIEMGVPEDRVFAPEKLIDSYLGLEDVELIREDLKLQGNTEDFIDLEIEMLTEKGYLKHEADKIRAALNNQKEVVLNERQALLNEYREKQESSLQRQRQENQTQFKQALDTLPGFMGAKIKPDLRDAIWDKYKQGAYDNILNDPHSLVELVLHKEISDKVIKHVENTAYQRGRDEKTKNLHNIPPVTGTSSSKVKEPKEINQWSALEEDFGDNNN